MTGVAENPRRDWLSHRLIHQIQGRINHWAKGRRRAAKAGITGQDTAKYRRRSSRHTAWHFTSSRLAKREALKKSNPVAYDPGAASLFNIASPPPAAPPA